MRRVGSAIYNILGDNGLILNLLYEVFTDEKRFFLNSFTFEKEGDKFTKNFTFQKALRFKNLDEFKTFLNEVQGCLPILAVDLYWHEQGQSQFYVDWLKSKFPFWRNIMQKSLENSVI